MGACASCCGGKRRDYDEFRYNRMDTSGSGSPPPHHDQVQKDREARERAAEQAEARQRQFEKSAVGRAALKSVKEAKKQERTTTGPTAQDWIS
eukprot:jgi/Chrzof1/12132/Cz06g22120.t1